MKAQELLKAQFEQAHQFFDMTIADCSPEVLGHKEDGWTINPIGALVAHVAVAEDALVQGACRGAAPLIMRDGWSEKLGISDPSPRQNEHFKELKVDLPIVREFYAAVGKETSDFLEHATEEELSREVDTPAGKMSVLLFLANIGSTHVTGHWGEIAALKGVQGLKGLPF